MVCQLAGRGGSFFHGCLDAEYESTDSLVVVFRHDSGEVAG